MLDMLFFIYDGTPAKNLIESALKYYEYGWPFEAKLSREAMVDVGDVFRTIGVLCKVVGKEDMGDLLDGYVVAGYYCGIVLQKGNCKFTIDNDCTVRFSPYEKNEESFFDAHCGGDQYEIFLKRFFKMEELAKAVA